MATNNKRREATRRQLETQLRERQVRAARRKQAILISSIAGTVVVIALVVILVVVLAGGSSKKKTPAAASSAPSPTTSSSPSASTSSSAAATIPVPKTACAKANGKATATFDGVTVGDATNLKHEPKVRSTSKKAAKALTCMDLVTGKGAPATDASTVSVQYTGVLYANGKEFDSSWAGGKPASFALNQVVPGFTQGIGGAGKVAPMRVGGRRIMILPSALAYGAAGSGSSVPPNASLVFVVDLLKVS